MAELPHWLYQKRGWIVGMGNIHKMTQSNNDKLAQYVGKKLRQIRESHSLTRGELAERSKVVETDIIEFEEGKKRPNADQIIHLSQALNVTPSIFYR